MMLKFIKTIKIMFVGLSVADNIELAEVSRNEHAKQALYHAHMVTYQKAEIDRLKGLGDKTW